jgi:hypothetical protein
MEEVMDKAQQEATAAQLQGVFDSLGQTMLAIVQNQKVMAEKLNEVIVDRDAQVDLVGTLLKQNETLTEQVVVLTKLVDSDHAAVEVLMSLAGLNAKPAKC